MSTVREHLMDAHNMIAVGHRKAAKRHHDMADALEEDDPHYAYHKGSATDEEDLAEKHEAKCQECEKAAQADLEKHANDLRPTNVRAVYPANMVPRAGQPGYQADNQPQRLAVPVAEGFEKIFDTEDATLDN